MQDAPTHGRARRLATLAAAAVLIVFGVVSAVQGLDGRSTVRNALGQEVVVGEPQMTPAAIAAMTRKAGLGHLALPTCSVAGRPIDDGADARCFAQYMRIDALLATGGKTYAQMPRYGTRDGRGTNDLAAAIKLPNGVGLPNPARNVWITETALSTALNTSYMAEQLSLFGIAVGAAFLLVGLALGAFALAGTRMPSLAAARRPAREPAAFVSR
jgi:hypothetical protein